MNSLKISITDDEREWIAAQVADGRYANASDYIREPIRRDHQAQKSLRVALIDGERSGTSKRSIREIAHEARCRLNSDADLHFSRERLSGRKIDL